MSKMNELQILQEENRALWAHNMKLQRSVIQLEKDKRDLTREYVLLKGKLNFVKKYGILDLQKFISDN